MGAYSAEQFTEFMNLYKKFSDFTLQSYGNVSTFEHGIFGQTVFHSHVHIIPYGGTADAIIPEGVRHRRSLQGFDELAGELAKNQGYLFFSIGEEKWLVDTGLATPRFFRDRYASALDNAERMDWKVARTNPGLMETFANENRRVINKWQNYSL